MSPPQHPTSSPNSNCIVAIGASAGGVSALQQLFTALPAHLPASFLVVLHVPPYSSSQLDQVLQSCTQMPVRIAQDKEALGSGTVYVARNDLHLMVGESGQDIRLTRGPKECRARPAIDVLFRSVATSVGPRAIGISLSGMLDDGTAGMWAIKEHKGLVLVQDPAQADHASMPQSVIDHVEVDLVAPVETLAAQLPSLIQRALGRESVPTNVVHSTEAHIAAEGNALQLGVMEMGEVSQYTCPDCHGVLVHIKEGSIVRFRCHTGHAFSIKTLLEEVNEAIDKGLWDTLRAMEERILLLREMGRIARSRGGVAQTDHCERQAKAAESRIEAIREIVLDPRFLGRLDP